MRMYLNAEDFMVDVNFGTGTGDEGVFFLTSMPKVQQQKQQQQENNSNLASGATTFVSPSSPTTINNNGMTFPSTTTTSNSNPCQTIFSLALDGRPLPIRSFDEQTPATNAAYYAFIRPDDSVYLRYQTINPRTDKREWKQGKPFKFGGFAFFDARFRLLSYDAMIPTSIFANVLKTYSNKNDRHDENDEEENEEDHNNEFNNADHRNNNQNNNNNQNSSTTHMMSAMTTIASAGNVLQISEAEALEPNDLRELEDVEAQGHLTWSKISTFPFLTYKNEMMRKVAMSKVEEWAWLAPDRASIAEPAGAFVVKDSEGRFSVHSVMLDVRMWTPRYRTAPNSSSSAASSAGVPSSKNKNRSASGKKSEDEKSPHDENNYNNNYYSSTSNYFGAGGEIGGGGDNFDHIQQQQKQQQQVQLGSLPPPVVSCRIRIVNMLAAACVCDDVDRFGLYSDEGELDLSALCLLFQYGAVDTIMQVLHKLPPLIQERSNQSLSWWVQNCSANRVVVACPFHPFSDAAIWIEDRGLAIAHWVALIGSETLLAYYVRHSSDGTRSAASATKTAVLKRTPLAYAVYSGNLAIVHRMVDLFGSSSNSLDAKEAPLTFLFSPRLLHTQQQQRQRQAEIHKNRNNSFGNNNHHHHTRTSSSSTTTTKKKKNQWKEKITQTVEEFADDKQPKSNRNRFGVTFFGTAPDEDNNNNNDDDEKEEEVTDNDSPSSTSDSENADVNSNSSIISFVSSTASSALLYTTGFKSKRRKHRRFYHLFKHRHHPHQTLESFFTGADLGFHRQTHQHHDNADKHYDHHHYSLLHHDRLNDNGFTPIHLAVWFRSTDIVKFLLSLGANPNIKAIYPGRPKRLLSAYDVSLSKHAARCATQLVGWYDHHEKDVQPILDADDEVRSALNHIAWVHVGHNIAKFVLIFVVFVAMWLTAVSPSFSSNVEYHPMELLRTNLAVPSTDEDVTVQFANFIDNVAVGALLREHDFMSTSGFFPLDTAIYVGWACSSVVMSGRSSTGGDGSNGAAGDKCVHSDGVLWNGALMHRAALQSSFAHPNKTKAHKAFVRVEKFDPAEDLFTSAAPYSYETDTAYSLHRMHWMKLNLISSNRSSSSSSNAATNSSITKFFQEWSTNATTSIRSGAAELAQSMVFAVGFTLVHTQSARVFPVFGIFENLANGYQNAILRTIPVPLAPYTHMETAYILRLLVLAAFGVCLVIYVVRVSAICVHYAKRLRLIWVNRNRFRRFKDRVLRLIYLGFTEVIVPVCIGSMFLSGIILAGILETYTQRYSQNHFHILSQTSNNFTLIENQEENIIVTAVEHLINNNNNNNINNNYSSTSVTPADFFSMSELLLGIRRLCGYGVFFAMMGLLFALTYMPEYGQLLSFLRLFGSTAVILACFAIIVTGAAVAAFSYMAYGIGWSGARSIRYAFIGGIDSVSNGLTIEENTPTVDPVTLHVWILFYGLYCYQILAISLWVVISNEYEGESVRRYWWRDIQQEYLSKKLHVYDDELENVTGAGDEEMQMTLHQKEQQQGGMMMTASLRGAELHRWNQVDDRGRRTVD